MSTEDRIRKTKIWYCKRTGEQCTVNKVSDKYVYYTVNGIKLKNKLNMFLTYWVNK